MPALLNTNCIHALEMHDQLLTSPHLTGWRKTNKWCNQIELKSDLQNEACSTLSMQSVWELFLQCCFHLVGYQHLI